MCCLINHVYMHIFRSIIEATEKSKQEAGNFPRGRGDLNKNYPKIQMPRALPGGFSSIQ